MVLPRYRIVGSHVYDAQTGQELQDLNVKAIQAADATWIRLEVVKRGGTAMETVEVKWNNYVPNDIHNCDYDYWWFYEFVGCIFIIMTTFIMEIMMEENVAEEQTNR